MILIRPIRNAELFEKAKAAANDDGHGVLQPTHVILKDEEVVGAFSISLPSVSFWMDSKCGPRDSLAAFQGLDTLLAAAGTPLSLFPCERGSPYHSLLLRPELGFERIPGEWDVFLKRT